MCVCVYARVSCMEIKRKTRGKHNTERGIRLTQYARDSRRTPARTPYSPSSFSPAASTITTSATSSFSGHRLIDCVRTRQRGRHEIRLSTVSTTTTTRTTTTTTHLVISGLKKLPDTGWYLSGSLNLQSKIA